MYKIEVVQMERKMHEHIELNHAHVLLYCKTCDIVYCEGCKKEWKKEIPTLTYPTTVWYGNTTGHDHYTFPDNDTTAVITIS